MVNDQNSYIKVINDDNRTRICLNCFEINKIKNSYCYYCSYKLKKFPNQLPHNYVVDFSRSNNGAIYFFNLDKKQSYWYPFT